MEKRGIDHVAGLLYRKGPLLSARQSDVEGVLLKCDAAHRDLVDQGLSSAMLILFDHGKLPARVQRLDLRQGHRYVAEHIAVKSDCTGDNTHQLAAELIAISEGNSVGSLRMGWPGTEQQQGAKQKTWNKAA
jgi:hypothetical protein